MLNTVSEQDLQQQGLAIIEQAMKKGVVHILKSDKPCYVVLTEKQYQHLSKLEHKPNILSTILEKPCTGSRTKEDINSQVSSERTNWNGL